MVRDRLLANGEGKLIAMASILCLQHVQHEPPGLIGEVLEARGHALRTLRTSRERIPPEVPPGTSALVVMGGPQAVYELERNPWMAGEVNLVRRALRAGLPVLGVCLGSQILAAAGGARVFSGAAGREIGWDQVTLTPEGRQDPLARGLMDDPSTSSAQIFHWHGDTFDLPAGAVRLASSTRYPNQGFRLGANAYGFQFHFEVNGEMIATWVERGADYVREGGFESEPILAGRDTQLDSLLSRGRKLVEAFAELIAARERAAAG
jgi:GMP synthase (glutamine-hydrolysing)